MIEHSDDDSSGILTEPATPSPPTRLESGGKGMPAGPILEALGRCTPSELVLDDDDDYQLDDIENSRNERSPTFVNRISSIPQCGALPPLPSVSKKNSPKQKSGNEEEVVPTIPPPPSIRKVSPRATSNNKHMVTEQFKLHYQKLPKSEQIKLLKEVKLVLGDESILTGLYDGHGEEEDETAKHYKGKDDEDESLLQSSVDNSTSRRSKGSQYDETTTAFGTQFTGAGDTTTAFGTIDDDQTNTAFYTLDTTGEDTNTAFGTLYTNYTMDTRNTLDTKDTMDDTFMSGYDRNGSVLSDVYSDSDDDDEPFFNLTDACVTYLCDGKYSEGPNDDEQKAKEAREQRARKDNEKERVDWNRHKRYKERLESFNKSDSGNSNTNIKKDKKKRSDDDKSNIDDSMLGSWAVGPANKYDNPHTALGHYNKANKNTPLTVKERLEMKQGLMKPKSEPVLEEVLEEVAEEIVVEEPKPPTEQTTSTPTLEEKLQGVKEATENTVAATSTEPSEKPFWKENTSVWNVDDDTTAIQSSVFWKGDGVFDADEGTTEIGAIECEANVDDSEVALNGSGTSSNTADEQSALLQCGRSTPLEMPNEASVSSLDKPNLLTKARSFGRSKSFTRVISTLSQKISRLDESQQQDGTARLDAELLTFESEISLDNATKGSNSTNKTTSNSSSDSNSSSLSPKKKGWKQYTCPTSSRPYYSNGILTTWDRPANTEITKSRPSSSTVSRICPRSCTPISVGGESSGVESASTPIASNVLEKVELSLPPKQHKKKKSFNLGFFKSKKNTTDRVPAYISKTVPPSPDRTVTSTSTSSSKQDLANIATDPTGADSISLISSSKKKKRREWKEYIDKNTGKKYYSNGISTSWDKPDGFVVALASGGESTYTETCSTDAAITSSASIARKLTRWREYTDVCSGKKYYSNGISTIWDRPDNFFNEHTEGVC